MVFKIPNGSSLIGYTSYYSLYSSTDSYNDHLPTAIASVASGSLPYKSPIIDEWNTCQTVLSVSFLFTSFVNLI